MEDKKVIRTVSGAGFIRQTPDKHLEIWGKDAETVKAIVDYLLEKDIISERELE